MKPLSSRRALRSGWGTARGDFRHIPAAAASSERPADTCGMMVKAQTISMLAMTGPQRGALAISNGGDIITAAADMEPLWTAPDFSRWQNLTLVRKGIAGDQVARWLGKVRRRAYVVVSRDVCVPPALASLLASRSWTHLLCSARCNFLARACQLNTARMGRTAPLAKGARPASSSNNRRNISRPRPVLQARTSRSNIV